LIEILIIIFIIVFHLLVIRLRKLHPTHLIERPLMNRFERTIFLLFIGFLGAAALYDMGITRLSVAIVIIAIAMPIHSVLYNMAQATDLARIERKLCCCFK